LTILRPGFVRSEFEALVRSCWALHIDPELGDKRIRTMDGRLERIQQLFEGELSAYAWLPAVR